METSATASPSRTPCERKRRTAAFARGVICGVRWVASNTTANVRPTSARASVFEETASGSAAATSSTVSATSTARKLVTACTAPSP